MQEHSIDASAWVLRFAHLAPRSAHVLDLACGAGRHTRFFAERGCEVTAVDRDASLLEPLRSVPNVRTVVADLEIGTWPLAGRSFDAVVVVNYLHRPLFADLATALTPDGVLLYETFAVGNEAFGRPRNPDFLLQPGELLEAFARTTTVVAFEQGVIHEGHRPAVVQRLAAVGRGRAWPASLTAQR